MSSTPQRGSTNLNVQLPATILVADDMGHNRELLATMLRGVGYRVVLAADGEEALDLLVTGPIDLALLDVMMPARTGMSVCREIRSKSETRLLPVLLITGLNSTEERVKGIECGADDFLTEPIVREELMARVGSLLRIKEFTDGSEHAELVLFSVALSMEAKDPYMRGHCDRIAKNSVALGRRIGLKDDQLIALRRGGYVHDIGRVGIPDHILHKVGPLSEDEWILMKIHPEIGEKICKPLRSFNLVLPIIRHHHEKLDGSGYPDGLKNDAIPLAAQVLPMADIYDGLTRDRSYGTGVPPEKAFEILATEVERGWRDGDLLLQLQALIQEQASLHRAGAVPTLLNSWG